MKQAKNDNNSTYSKTHKKLFITEKPSVARDFAKALHVNGGGKDGYIEDGNTIITWCVGHLVTMSYPEKYDPDLKSWKLDTLPFLPKTFKYEVIESVAKQFGIVKTQIERKDVDHIFYSGDAAREGEYIQRLVRQFCNIGSNVEELASYHTSPNSKNSAEDADNKTGCDVTPTADTVTSTTDSATSEAEMSTLGTQNKEKQIKTNQNKLNHLSDSPQGENGGGKILKRRKVMTQEEIDNLQPPSDGTQRNFEGLLENLRSYKIPPSEQYAIILKSNFGAIGNPVWKGFSNIRGSNGKIKLPGHYLLSVIN